MLAAGPTPTHAPRTAAVKPGSGRGASPPPAALRMQHQHQQQQQSLEALNGCSEGVPAAMEGEDDGENPDSLFLGVSWDGKGSCWKVSGGCSNFCSMHVHRHLEHTHCFDHENRALQCVLLL